MQRPALAALATRAGIEPFYFTLGGERRETSDETAERLLEAMGLPAPTEDAARHALEAWDARLRTHALEPVRVLERPPHDQAGVLEVPHLASGVRRFRISIELEHGESWSFEGDVLPESTAQSVSLALRGALPLGYHTLRCALDLHDGHVLSSAQQLIVVPTEGHAPPRRATGLSTQLYSVRGGRDSGIGDFETLRELIDFAAALELDFIALNPLCALDLRAEDVSPYAPTTRLALHPAYLDTGLASAAGAPSARIEYARVLAQKLAAAQRDMHAGSAELDPLLGAAIDRYALFTALAEHTGSRDFRQWPSELRDPTDTAVARFAEQHAPRIAFHRDLQRTLDAQLGAAARHARERALRMGLIADLPVGSAAGGADTWSQPQLFANGVALGAPPDDYARDGQSWGLTPIVPWRSRLEGHRFFTALVRRAMRHAGGLRIDHILGFIRQYWVPDGRGGREGAYVRGPAQEWLGIVALESVRSGCVVLGEDLGTVPDGLREELARRHMLRSHVLFFERDHAGRFTDPEQYSERAMASAFTHDLPAFAELWDGRDLSRRRELGLLDDEALRGEREARARMREVLLGCLRDAGVLAGYAEPEPEPEPAAVVRAIYAWLARTPALLSVALDDLALEPEGVNVPGTGTEVPNWTRRMHRSLAELRADEALCAFVREIARSRRATTDVFSAP